MNFKAQGSINTMSTMTKAQVRAYEKNNIRRELLTEDVPCDFCGKDFRPMFRNQRFCSNKNKCSDSYWEIRRLRKQQGLQLTQIDLLEKLERKLINSNPKRIMFDLIQKTVFDITAV